MIYRILIFLLLPLLALASPDDDYDIDQELYNYYEGLVYSLVDTEYEYKLDDEKIYFGPEFTFWVPNNDSRPDAEASELADAMADHLVHSQKEELKFKTSKKFDTLFGYSITEFKSPFDWSFQVKPDGGVVEVTMAPMDAENYKLNSAAIEDAIFVSAANMGYFPSLYGGGGHINISTGYLKKNPLLFRNFIVDLLNHNELFLGVLGFDTNNALSPSLMRSDIWESIKYELNYMDAYEADLDSLTGFIDQVKRMMKDSQDPYLQFWHPSWKARSKYTAIHFKSKYNDQGEKIGIGDRIEIRAVRAQASADVWVRQVQLLEKRIQYLETLDKPLKLNPMVKVEKLLKLPENEQETKDAALNPPVDPQEALSAFHQYVTESGENWADHQDYLWPQWISGGELDKFNEQNCSSLLGESS